MMKPAALTFGILLTITFGVVQGVDLPWVTLEFAFGIEEGKLPAQVVQGVNATTFVQDYLMLVTKAFMRNIESYASQVYIGTVPIQEESNRLTQKITSSPSDDVEENLNNINKMFDDFIKIMSTNITRDIDSYLPGLPPKIEETEADMSPKTAIEIITNYPILQERNFARIRQFMDNIYMTGWAHARHFHIWDQESMRNMYGRMLKPHFLAKSDEIKANAKMIEGRVSPGVWTDFMTLSEALKSINTR